MQAGLAWSLLCGVLLASCSGAEETTENAVACGLAEEALGRFATLPAGDFVKGRDPLYAEEGPPMRLHVAGFAIQANEVTNAEFARFVEATGHVTDAERSGGAAVFVGPEEGALNGWRYVEGADWRHPQGPGSSIDGKALHPVVQVSQRDAQAYARWAGGRLPSEIEWEYAAATGLPDPDSPTSGALGPDREPRANIWQGVFPAQDLGSDGFRGTAPVGCFPADGHGLADMIGNVWEWTATPAGATQHVIKGGSHLCAGNFCRRYRPASRQPQDSDFSTSHIGFRIVRDAPDQLGQ